MTDHPAWAVGPDAIRLRITLANHEVLPALRNGTFAVINGVQRYDPAIQLQAIFLAGTAMAQSLGLDAHDMVSRAIRQLPDVEAFSNKLEAVREYSNELR